MLIIEKDKMQISSMVCRGLLHLLPQLSSPKIWRPWRWTDLMF